MTAPPILLDEIRTRDQLIAYLFDLVGECSSKLIDVHESGFADKIVARGSKASDVYGRIVEAEGRAGGLL